MFMNPGTVGDILGVPIAVVVLGVANIGFVVGLSWFWRITRGPEDGDASWWRFRR